MSVYFIQAGEGGSIKIGTSTHPKKRLRGLQTSHDTELRLLAAIEGGEKLEAELHERLAPWHVRGEWFRPSPEVLAVVQETIENGGREEQGRYPTLLLRILPVEILVSQQKGRLSLTRSDIEHSSPKEAFVKIPLPKRRWLEMGATVSSDKTVTVGGDLLRKIHEVVSRQVNLWSVPTEYHSIDKAVAKMDKTAEERRLVRMYREYDAYIDDEEFLFEDRRREEGMAVADIEDVVCRIEVKDILKEREREFCKDMVSWLNKNGWPVPASGLDNFLSRNDKAGRGDFYESYISERRSREPRWLEEGKYAMFWPPSRKFWKEITWNSNKNKTSKKTR